MGPATLDVGTADEDDEGMGPAMLDVGTGDVIGDATTTGPPASSPLAGVAGPATSGPAEATGTPPLGDVPLVLPSIGVALAAGPAGDWAAALVLPVLPLVPPPTIISTSLLL